MSSVNSPHHLYRWKTGIELKNADEE